MMTSKKEHVQKSWIEIPSRSDFSLFNIPFGVFKKGEVTCGVAIGDHVLDLQGLEENGFFNDTPLAPKTFSETSLNKFFAQGRPVITAIRNRVIELLSESNDRLRSDTNVVAKSLHRRNEVEMKLPVVIPNYTDFYSSEEHAINVGSIFRDPKNPLLPNWKHLPVGYHGRASSIVVSGTPIHRPNGQIKKAEKANPHLAASEKLDFELEMAFISCGQTEIGHAIRTEDAEKYIAGFVLFNDWSARDIQQWEYVPLGPFLGKNFASTVSPWVVTLDALEYFRCDGPSQEPPVLPYLKTQGSKNFDIQLQVCISAQSFDTVTLCRSNFKYMYWNVNQQLAHHTVNGCNIMVGDLFASGTISGPSPGSFGSLLELSWNGEKKLNMPDGTVRTFLEDGDNITLTAYAEKDGVRVGFGECSGTILPAK